MKPISPAPRDPRAASLFRAAFNDVHGERLHGFVVMLTVGDLAAAARIAANVMVSGMARAAELRHPERAAAWLRSKAYREVRRTAARRSVAAIDRRTALWQLRVASEVTDTLWALPLEERAVLIADVVEGLDLRDVATIIGRNPARTSAIARAARHHYLASATARMARPRTVPVRAGQVAIQIESAAAFAVGPAPVRTSR